MREIKFRGYSKEEKDWIYGLYLQKAPSGGMRVFDHAIVSPGYYGKEVSENSLGQFTGLYDGDGVEIYEGDILGLEDSEDDSKFIVEYHQCSFQKKYLSHHQPVGPISSYDLKDIGFVVIGNIYDNPELIKPN